MQRYRPLIVDQPAGAAGGNTSGGWSTAAIAPTGNVMAAASPARRVPTPAQAELPVPFPLRTVNAWLFSGTHPALVDCGIGTPESYRLLHEAAKEAGLDLGTATLYLTHGHVDHVGNAHRLQVDHRIRLAAPEAERPFVESFRRDAERRNDEFADALRHHGMPAADVQRIRADSDAIDAYTEDARLDAPLADGQRVVMGDQDVTVVRTPGHTPGSTSYLTEAGQFLCGDTLLEHITSNAVELRDADQGNFHTYVQTVDALRRFVGVDCLPGHHAPFALTDAVLDRHLSFHEERRNKILAVLHRPKTAYQVMRELYPEWTSDPKLFMGMAEIVGHLHSLEADGKVRRQEDADGGRRFTRTS